MEHLLELCGAQAAHALCQSRLQGYFCIGVDMQRVVLLQQQLSLQLLYNRSHR